MKRFFKLFIYFFLVDISTLQAQSPAVPFARDTLPKREMRAVWLTTLSGLDWPKSQSAVEQKRELCRILDRLEQAGINTVLLQTRVRATTIYPSSIEPWDKAFTGSLSTSPPSYDPLAFAIAECHKRGMALHAWVVAIPVGKWNERGCASLRKTYPKLVKRIGEDGYMDPENSQTAEYIAKICEEIVKKYDVDGIHLDYIRYPETWKLKVSEERGRGYVTNIVRRVHDRVKSMKPWVMVSCSPVGKYRDLPRQSSVGWNAYSRVCQEAQAWLEKGWMDALFPMMYFRDEHFFPFALDWSEHTYGRIVAPGLGIYFLSPREKNWNLNVITQQLETLRQFGMGHAFFRSQFFTNNVKGIYNFTEHTFDRSLALTPAMTWEKNEAPSAPSRLSVDSVSHKLTWSGAVDHSGGPYLTYNVYASRTYPVDVSDGRNLVKMRSEGQSTFAPLMGEFYAVTAMDRYGNESEATQQAGINVFISEPTHAYAETPALHFCDTNTLRLDLSQLNSTDLIQISTPSGRVLKTFLVSSVRRLPTSIINLKDLPDGFYQIRTLGKKNISHRLAFIHLHRP